MSWICDPFSSHTANVSLSKSSIGHLSLLLFKRYWLFLVLSLGSDWIVIVTVIICWKDSLLVNESNCCECCKTESFNKRTSLSWLIECFSSSFGSFIFSILDFLRKVVEVSCCCCVGVVENTNSLCCLCFSLGFCSSKFQVMSDVQFVRSRRSNKFPAP